MAGLINTGSFPQDLRPGIKMVFGDAYKDWDSKYDKIFETRSSDRNYEEDMLVPGFGLVPEMSEGSAVSYDSSQQGITPRYRHLQYGLGFIITQNMVDDGIALGNAAKWTKRLKFSALRTKEIVAANILNRAFNSSYVMNGGDGKELCATDHPTLNGSQRNELSVAADLSEAALEQAIIDIMDTVDHRGVRIMLQPKKLIIPTALVMEAERIVKSNLRVGTADNDLNAIKSLNFLPEGVLVNPYLTDSDAWFITTDAPEGLVYYNRKDMTLSVDNDFETDNLKTKVVFRCSFGWSDFKGIFGSPGA